MKDFEKKKELMMILKLNDREKSRRQKNLLLIYEICKNYHVFLNSNFLIEILSRTIL